MSQTSRTRSGTSTNSVFGDFVVTKMKKGEIYNSYFICKQKKLL